VSREIDRLLYEGETVEDRVEWAEASVVRTSHRVLVFSPDTEGANFRGIDRPNVEGIETGARSRGGLLERGLRYGLIGAILLVAGLAVDFDGIAGGVTVGASMSELGVGGIGSLIGGLLAFIRRLDDLMRILGALALLLGVVLVGVFWYTRTPTVNVAVAGEEDVTLPRPDERTRDRLRELLAPVGAGADDDALLDLGA
jgi:hypothetical protein